MTEALIAFVAFCLGAITIRIFWNADPSPAPIELTAPEPRTLSDEQKVARATRAKMAMDEFLAPALQSIGAEYLTALSQLAANEPWETAKITKLAVAQRVIKAVEQHIIMAVLDGQQAADNLDRARKIAALPEAKRKYL